MPNLFVLAAGGGFLDLPELWYNFCIVFKRWAVVIIVGSLLLGLVIYSVFGKTRDIQKWAFDLLILKIPIFTFILVYVFAGLYKAMNLI